MMPRGCTILFRKHLSRVLPAYLMFYATPHRREVARYHRAAHSALYYPASFLYTMTPNTDTLRAASEEAVYRGASRVLCANLTPCGAAVAPPRLRAYRWAPHMLLCRIN